MFLSKLPFLYRVWTRNGFCLFSSFVRKGIMTHNDRYYYAVKGENKDENS